MRPFQMWNWKLLLMLDVISMLYYKIYTKYMSWNVVVVQHSTIMIKKIVENS